MTNELKLISRKNDAQAFWNEISFYFMKQLMGLTHTIMGKLGIHLGITVKIFQLETIPIL